MTKRIFRSICAAAFGVFLASAALFMWVLYDYFSAVQARQLRAETDLAARGVANEGAAFLEGLDTSRFRVTWIDPQGEVLYDSETDARDMENHLEREEVREALKSGAGESSRYSATLTERAFYRAQQLPDGSVLRLSVSLNSLFTLFMGMLQPIIIIVIIALVLALLLASRLSRQIVKPLNELDLDDPLKNEGYDELSPLLRRIDAQQREIRAQSEKLTQKQREFDAVTDNMAEGIILLTDRGVILAINRAARQIFGVEGPCEGRDILSVSRVGQVPELLDRARGGMHGEAFADLPQGRYQLTASPVMSEGAVSGAVLLAVDVTEKERREQLRREFTANVSHELKTPLHTIAGSAELLLGGVVREEDRRDFYERIYSEARRMTRLVEDIIHLSRLDEGAGDMRRESADLYALARETVNALAPEAEKAGVTLTLRGGAAAITGIPQLLGGMIYNLCDNAIKYNREGGSVTVEVADGPDSAVLTVSDTGIGIPMEHQSRVFERFYRVDKSRSKERGGTGLGLSIVKRSALLHNAKINLDSRPDEGTRVTVTFPKS